MARRVQDLVVFAAPDFFVVLWATGFIGAFGAAAFETRVVDWTPQFDDLETIATHALAWEEKLFQDRGGLVRHAESA